MIAKPADLPCNCTQDELAALAVLRDCLQSPKESTRLSAAKSIMAFYRDLERRAIRAALDLKAVYELEKAEYLANTTADLKEYLNSPIRTSHIDDANNPRETAEAAAPAAGDPQSTESRPSLHTEQTTRTPPSLPNRVAPNSPAVETRNGSKRSG